MKRGDVVLIVAPGDLGKPRPGVIVQADELGDGTTTIIVCPMSSEIGPTERLRPVVEPSAANGLRLQTQIMTDKIIAMRRDRVRRIIGHLEASARGKLDRALLIVLGFAQRPLSSEPTSRRRRSSPR